MSTRPDSEPPRPARAARRRGWSFDQPVLLPGPRSRLAWSALEFATPPLAFFAGVGGAARETEWGTTVLLFLFLTLAASALSSLRSSVGPEFTIGDVGFLRRTVCTRDIAEFTVVNDVRAAARLVDGRRLTLLWLHAGTSGHAWDEAPVIADHARSMLEVARLRPTPTRARSGRIVALSIIRWRLAFWVGLVAASPFPYLLGSEGV